MDGNFGPLGSRKDPQADNVELMPYGIKITDGLTLDGWGPINFQDYIDWVKAFGGHSLQNNLKAEQQIIKYTEKKLINRYGRR